MKAAPFDEKPNLAFQHVIDLLGFMGMRRGMISGRSHGVHQTALVAVAAAHHHGAFSFNAGAHHFALRDVRRFYVQSHCWRSFQRSEAFPYFVSSLRFL
jgi:hypothetical protein